ncbi:MAG: primase C-terminal domain-containing protein, partial [Firmicutes bacterium]|nr:primase C-terminal domain-containing protein [Bacillota bacterium]
QLLYGTLMKIVNGEIKGLPAVYWKPNTFFRDDKSQKDCLRWLNALFIDLDEEGLSSLDVFDRVYGAGLPEPTLINETPHGWHIFWAIEQVRAWPEKIKRYEKVARAMVKALEGADPHAASAEKFMRLPRNVKHFSEARYTLEDFEDWQAINELDTPTEKARVYYITQCLNHDAIKELLKGVEEGMRDNACFTLALCFYKDGHAQVEAMAALKEWNLKNSPPLPYHVIPQKVRSAYSGKYHGPSGVHVYDLTGIPFNSRPITPAKPREERIRDHLWEVKEDILKYLKDHGGRVGGQSGFSQTFFAELLGVALSTFKTALKSLRKDGKVIAFIKGKGRAKKVVYALLDNVVSIVRERITEGIPWGRSGNGKLNHMLQELMVHSDIHSLGVVVGGLPPPQTVAMVLQEPVFRLE